jgi:hypothetical protein
MTVAKLDKRAGDLSARADALVERMEETAARYLDAITPWVADQFSAAVDAAVSGAPEITQEMGQEGLSRLRAALDALAAATPDLVRKRAGAPGAWPHRWVGGAPIVAGLYGTKAATGKRQVAVPSCLDSRLRLLLGTAGHLLAKHGYRSFVRRTFSRAYVRSDYHPPEYLSRSLDGHEQFLPILGEYGDLCDEYAGVLADLGRAGQERGVRAAESLWKQA